MLDVRDIHVDLGGREILRGISASVPRGSLAAVVGPNGAGKSTLLRVAAALVSARKGVVEIDGRPTSAYLRRDLGRVVAYLPQDRTVAWPLTVEAVVALGRLPHASRFAGRSPRDTAAVSDALAAMDASHLATRTVTELSGGERARVLIARALAQDAPILLADEPTAGLDPAHALALFQHLASLAGAGRCVVLATHDLSMAARFASSVLLLDHGVVTARGSPADVFGSACLGAAFGVRMTVGHIGGLPAVLPLQASRT